MERALALTLAAALGVCAPSAPAAPPADDGPDARITCQAAAVDDSLLPRLRASVREEWTLPAIARVGAKGIVSLRATLGREPAVEVTRASGPSALAAHAKLALQRGIGELVSARSVPEPPCTVTWSFYYNASAAERRDWLEGLESPLVQP